MIDGRDIPIAVTGIRPGEKIHEIMVSEEECYRTIGRGDYYVIGPMLPELRAADSGLPVLGKEYSSSDITLDHDGLRRLVRPYMTDAALVSEFA